MIEGCLLQIAGLALVALTVATVAAPTPFLLALVLIVVGYGQGLVMAPLSGAVLSTVQASSAGSGSGLYGTATQISSAAGIAAIGSVFFSLAAAASGHFAFLVALTLIAGSVAGSIVLLHWMRRAALVPS